MSDPERLERYLDEFGARLSQAAAATRSAPRARRRFIVAAGAAAAGAAAVLVLLLAGGSGRRLDPVAEARAALAPPGDIVYMKITSTPVKTPGLNSVPHPQTTEQWSLLHPKRWRFVQTIPPASAHVGTVGDAEGAIVGRQEFSYAGGVQRSYIAARDTLSKITGVPENGSNARLPSVLGAGSGDVQADLSSLLARGKVSDRGELEADGRSVRRFVIVRSTGDGHGIASRFVYDVDPQTYAPVAGTLTFMLPRRPLGSRTLRISTRLRVDAYERIPFTPASAKLLRIALTPQTTVTSHSQRELSARAARELKACRKLASGDLACPMPARLLPKPPARARPKAP